MANERGIQIHSSQEDGVKDSGDTSALGSLVPSCVTLGELSAAQHSWTIVGPPYQGSHEN